MPKGIPNRKRDEIIIGEELPPSAGRAHSEIKHLLREYTEKARAFFIVDQELSLRATERAKVNGTQKFLQAANTRTEARAMNGVEALPKKRGPYKKKRAPKSSGATARERERLAKVAICGPRLNLFLLEKFDDDEYRTNEWMLTTLKQTGKADHIERLSGVYGLLTLEKLLKHDDRGYKRTAAGRAFAASLRKDLEKNGECLPGEYLAPSDYSTKRRVHGFDSKQHSARLN